MKKDIVKILTTILDVPVISESVDILTLELVLDRLYLYNAISKEDYLKGRKIFIELKEEL